MTAGGGDDQRVHGVGLTDHIREVELRISDRFGRDRRRHRLQVDLVHVEPVTARHVAQAHRPEDLDAGDQFRLGDGAH